MFVYNDLQLELLKTQKALDMLGTVLSSAEFNSVCGSLIQHRDRLRSRLSAYGLKFDSQFGEPQYEPVSRSHKKLFDAWTQFVNTGEVSTVISPVIAASWKRCWARVNPIQDIHSIRLNEAHLLSTQVASFDLISVARPILEDVHQCIEKAGAVIALVNGAGCVLDLIASPETREILMERWGVTTGSILTEELLGTNAIGLAITDRMAAEVIGPEHYLQKLHNVAGAAAPIFSMSGRLLGVVGVFTWLDQYHFYSLGLAAASARAIENQHQSDQLLTEQNNHLAQLNTILATISDGILVWGGNQIVQHVNKAAEAILALAPETMMGKPVNAVLAFPDSVNEAIENSRPLTDVEVNITIDRRGVTCLVNLDFVFNNSDLKWTIMTLRTERQVRSLVAQQFGAIAPLTLDDIPGDSSHIQQMRAFIRSAAKAQAGVLIRGEPGTGKNALANAIHNVSHRRDAPFVSFACSTIPAELIIRELLGFDEVVDGRRSSSRPSKFELAQGGTIFFQEIDALPLEAQTVLLNALESGKIQRQGNRRLIDIDVRAVASTSAPIENLIAQGGFRPELYYWISIFSITLPPLRERPRDISQVVERILKRLAVQWGLPALELAPGVIDVLKRYPWPGNIREIESVLGRAATQVGQNGLITLNLLPAEVRNSTPALMDDQSGVPVRSMIELERQAIMRTAQVCQGNVTLMAQTLEISRTTLWRRMREFGIQPKDYRA